MQGKNMTIREFMEIGNKSLQNTPYSLYQTEKYNLLRIHKNTNNRQYSLRNGPGGNIYTNKAAIQEFVKMVKDNDMPITSDEEKMLKEYLEYVGVSYQTEGFLFLMKDDILIPTEI